ncbi:nucleolus and neural progenitor protein [Condylostylus longicornis]|uniref:nucleolus and neural progenitor protein n=1 Tax=Condylostylus longicornis TaxID=2530218 RepID=UPI00244E2F80|nr:nucleolus and neural progenitor protein [Condylostylus longicornis]
MEYLWNNIELPMPPLKTVAVKRIKFDLIKLRKILQDAIDFFECQINFNENALLCTKLIMKRKNSFKHFKGFQDMSKVKATLNKLEKINLPNVLKNFIGLLPESIFSLELPPKANLDYVLLRIIGYYNVLNRATNCCKNAVAYFVKIFQKYFFFETLSLFLSVLSKIWYDGNLILKFTSKLYIDLKNFLQYLPPNNIKYNFDDFIFPKRLGDIEDTISLNEENFGKKDEINNIQKLTLIMKQKPVDNINSIITDQSCTDIGEVICREDIVITNNIESRNKKVVSKPKNLNSLSKSSTEKLIKSNKVSKTKSQNNENLLCVKETPTNNSVISKESKKKKEKHKMKIVKSSDNSIKIEEDSCMDEILKRINQIKTISEIKTFFTDESLRRKQSKNTLSTTNISNKEWSKFKKVILQKAKCEKEKRCVKIFKKFLNKRMLS